MAAIRIHFGYRTTDAPWGGANNFIRALRRELEATGRYEFTDSMRVDCDVLLMNQLSAGPGRVIRFADVRRFREGRRTLREQLARRAAARAAALVVRAVSLNRVVFRMGPRNLLRGRRRDAEVLALLNYADFVVFQSAYQQQIFTAHGYHRRRNTVIHNGADPVFWAPADSERPPSAVLRLAAATASPREQKRHDLIARLSLVAGVEVIHVGNWPAGLDSARVVRLGMVPQPEMAKLFARCDYLFYPAVRDACPNAIAEAVCSGLPVIYNSGPGSSAELVGDNGFALKESDLSETVAEARRLLPRLRANVLESRGRYSVARAAKQYSAVFEEMMS